MQAERSGVTTTDGIHLNVETTGPADAPVTVLLVHGWTCSTRAWHNQVDGLPQILGSQSVRVVTYDHRGHGRSDAAPPGSLRIAQLADDLVTVLDEVVGDGPVVYAGHSMGGMTLMELADSRPELFGSRIKAAALVSTSSGQVARGAFGIPPRFEPAAVRIAPRFAQVVGTRVDRRAERLAAAAAAVAADAGTAAAGVAAAAAEGAADAAGRAAGAVRGREAARAARANVAALLQRPALRQIVFGKKVDPVEIAIFQQGLALLPGASYSGFFEAILQHDRAHALKVLGEIPIEVMHGTRDRLLPPRHANRIAAEIPSARVWMYPGAGHMLPQERPRDVTHRLASLARKVLA
ncbi:alpha/beta hydrolase [Kribbella antibiotica]|uniref:Alpha/beta hydrolase n=1 Tax=Kribbella antibiotica TaxID=190195 RepID=A0A4R4Z2E7_9ACTN|nr:alpha/beta hydrolase [Kribbella antibiotica]